MEHTFAICAYKESPYLEACIQSLQNQTVPSKIIMATSTPNAYLNEMAGKYDIPLYVKDGESNIADDWNFAYSKADTPYVTITHQDDIYLPGYTEHALHAFRDSDKPLIFFCDYGELREGRVVTKNRLLRIKRFMLIPLQARIFRKSRFVRKSILVFGSPICCPSVAYARANLPETIFRVGFRSNEDWEAWEMLSHLPGDFLYDKSLLVYHRIHADSETTSIIHDCARSAEDMEMYSKFWPKPIAKLLVKLYANGQKSNNMN